MENLDPNGVQKFCQWAFDGGWEFNYEGSGKCYNEDHGLTFDIHTLVRIYLNE